MMKIGKKLDEAASETSLSSYFTDLSSVELLDPVTEAAAVRNIEKLESDMLRHMISNRDFFRNAIYQLNKLLEDQEVPGLKEAILSVSKSSPSHQAAYKFTRIIRFSEIGRKWMQLSYVRALDPKYSGTRDKWVNELRRKFSLQAKAKNNFVAANLRLVVRIAKYFRRFNSSQYAISDIIQEGNIGLMKAVERFDVERGYKFSTYAAWWIRHYIRRALGDKDALVRIPVHLNEHIFRIAGIERKHLTEFGEKISNEKLAELTRLPLKKIEAIIVARSKKSVSFDAPVQNDDTDFTLLDVVENDDAISPLDEIMAKECSDDICGLFSSLTPQEEDIIRRRFGFDTGDPLTLAQVAEKYDLSRERIRQIEVRAFDKLRKRQEVKEWKPEHRSETRYGYTS